MNSILTNHFSFKETTITMHCKAFLLKEHAVCKTDLLAKPFLLSCEIPLYCKQKYIQYLLHHFTSLETLY